MRRLFVISDLHLGGRPDDRDGNGQLVRAGYQICNAHRELSEFIDWVARQGERPGTVELVVNGDLVDFLADDDWDDPELHAEAWTADQARAIKKLDRIVDRCRPEGGLGVFGSLRALLDAGHRLTLVLGNHDVELALPAVRRHLTDLLGGDGHSRLRFVYDGEAHAVGPVLIEHGNRYDHWNAVNHDGLRQERSMLSRRLPVTEALRRSRYFTAPTGTYLVVHFINRIKARYRFIDLLKPEDATILPLLVALEPTYRPALEEIVKAGPVALHVLQQRGQPHMATPAEPWHAGHLGGFDPGKAGTSGGEGGVPPEEIESFTFDAETSLDRVLAEVLRSDVALLPRCSNRGEDLGMLDSLRDAGTWLETKVDQAKETADSASRYFKLHRGDAEQRLRALHAALRRAHLNDESFALDKEVDPYLSAARGTARAGKFRVVVYGHTHLPKQVRLDDAEDGPRWYFNTGTWCDVMRLPAGVAEPFEVAEPELQRFVGRLAGNDFGPYTRRYPTFLEIELTGDGDEARLASDPKLYAYCGPGRERSAPLTERAPPDVRRGQP